MGQGRAKIGGWNKQKIKAKSKFTGFFVKLAITVPCYQPRRIHTVQLRHPDAKPRSAEEKECVEAQQPKLPRLYARNDDTEQGNEVAEKLAAKHLLMHRILVLLSGL